MWIIHLKGAISNQLYFGGDSKAFSLASGVDDQ